MFWNRGVAERQGFEPWIPCGIHAFQACALSHSAISPLSANLYESTTASSGDGMTQVQDEAEKGEPQSERFKG